MFAKLLMVVAFCLLPAACQGSSPTPAPDVAATVAAEVKIQLATVIPAPTEPTATFTPALPKAAPVKNGLEPVPCSPNCNYDNVPVVGKVNWIEPPTVSSRGLLTLKAQLKEGIVLTVPSIGTGNNITLTNGADVLFGTVLPPAGPGWSWDPSPGQWIAHTYNYRDNTLTVEANIDQNAADQADLTLCLWKGRRGNENEVLDCTKVQRP